MPRPSVSCPFYKTGNRLAEGGKLSPLKMKVTFKLINLSTFQPFNFPTYQPIIPSFITPFLPLRRPAANTR